MMMMDIPFRTTIAITGVHSPEMYDDIKRMLGWVFQKGTDPRLFANVPTEDVDMLLANLNSTPGIKAEKLKVLQ
jgi:hypothetical protein